MRATWRVARAAVRRRKLQTTVIGLVVMTSAMTLVIALGLLHSVSAPFDNAFSKQRGAHAVAVFDTGRSSDAQLKAAAGLPGVEAAAGPFGQAVVELKQDPEVRLLASPDGGPVTVVGRADPAGPVDRVNLWAGRWAERADEIVVNLPDEGLPPGAGSPTGSELTAADGSTFTVVGLASSVSGTADAWVSPARMAELKPTAAQLLFRFTDSATGDDIRDALAGVERHLPKGALTASHSYLDIKAEIARQPAAYAPFLTTFGVLSLLVAVLIVANVVSGAVVAGFRHIGILKSLGFTPNQVTGVYLAMVGVPAVVGCVLGTVLGGLLADPLLHRVFQGPEVAIVQDGVGIGPWAQPVTLLGMLAVVLLAALVPALRARRLSPAVAVSAGSAQRTGRALRIQRRLTGSRLPRSVSLGAGLPFARPGRSAMTLAAIVLGVTTVTFATGLSTTVTRYSEASQGGGAVQAVVYAGIPTPGEPAPDHDDPATQRLLASLPGAEQVTALGYNDVRLDGYTRGATLGAYRGESSNLGDMVVAGRWMRGADEAVASGSFLNERDLAVGDRLTLVKGDRRERVRIVGRTLDGEADRLYALWPVMTALAPDQKANQYHVRLTDGTDPDTYLAAVRKADAGLDPTKTSPVNATAVTVVGASTLLTLLLGTVAALGVFNTVVLNTRERRRDLGMLKAIGMTPRQVTVMMVTSMATLGAVGSLVGIPLGILGHHFVVPRSFRAADIAVPDSMMAVWQAPALAALALAGVTIAAVGALVPSRAAARLTVAEVLHNE